MSKSPTLQDYLYRAIRAQILTGHLKYGDSLPSWAQLCTRYKVSLRTVKETMGALQADGYILTEKRKASTVVYQPEEAAQKSYIKALLARRNSILQTFEASQLLFPGMLVQGAALLQPEDWTALWQTCEKMNSCLPREAYGYFFQVLELVVGKFNNPLLAELLIDLKAYMELPVIDAYQPLFQQWRSCAYQHLGAIFQELEAGGSPALGTQVKAFLSMSTETAKTLLDKLYHTIEGDLPEESFFQWEAEKGRSCRYAQIAHELIWQIQQGIPTNRAFLPPISALATTYSVSTVTVRRALSMLQTLGIVESINGKGYQVTRENARPLNQCPLSNLFEEDLLLFLQGLQLILMTCKEVVASVFPRLSQEYGAFISRAAHQSTGALSVGMVISPLVASIPNGTLRQIYEQLKIMLKRGRGIAFAPVHELIPETLHVKCISLLVGLRQNDGALFAQEFYSLFAYMFTIARQMALDLGIHKAQNILLP